MRFLDAIIRSWAEQWTEQMAHRRHLEAEIDKTRAFLDVARQEEAMRKAVLRRPWWWVLIGRDHVKR